jgi:hypothetical protein
MCIIYIILVLKYTRGGEMEFSEVQELLFKFVSDRIKLRKEYLKLTDDTIAKKKVFVHYEAYDDPVKGDSKHDDSLPERYEAKKNPVGGKYYDSAIISRILNCKYKKYQNGRNSPNPYLIPQGYENLLVEQLQFADNKELFWGKEFEQEYIIKSFYAKLFETILEEENTEIAELINVYIGDYVAYSRCLAEYNMLKEICKNGCNILQEELKKNGYSLVDGDTWKKFVELSRKDPSDIKKIYKNNNNDYVKYIVEVVYFHIIFFIKNKLEDAGKEDDIEDKKEVDIEKAISYSIFYFWRFEYDLKEYRKEAIGRIIFTNFEKLRELYNKVFVKLDNFKLLKKNIDSFVKDDLLNFLKCKLGDIEEFKSYSLGYRVKTIIETEIYYIISYFLEIEIVDDATNEKISSVYDDLFNSAVKYIKKLELIQWYTNRKTASIELKANDNIEYYYSRLLNIELQKKEWEDKYNEALEKEQLKRYGEYIEEEDYEALLRDNGIEDDE